MVDVFENVRNQIFLENEKYIAFFAPYPPKDSRGSFVTAMKKTVTKDDSVEDVADLLEFSNLIAGSVREAFNWPAATAVVDGRDIETVCVRVYNSDTQFDINSTDQSNSGLTPVQGDKLGDAEIEKLKKKVSVYFKNY